jgi:hypothetical protein
MDTWIPDSAMAGSFVRADTTSQTADLLQYGISTRVAALWVDAVEKVTAEKL